MAIHKNFDDFEKKTGDSMYSSRVYTERVCTENVNTTIAMVGGKVTSVALYTTYRKIFDSWQYQFIAANNMY